MDHDGHLYTLSEFKDEYGGIREWELAVHTQPDLVSVSTVFGAPKPVGEVQAAAKPVGELSAPTWPAKPVGKPVSPSKPVGEVESATPKPVGEVQAAAKPAVSVLELRVDSADGHAYTLSEFLEEYGTSGGKQAWALAPIASATPKPVGEVQAAAKPAGEVEPATAKPVGEPHAPLHLHAPLAAAHAVSAHDMHVASIAHPGRPPGTYAVPDHDIPVGELHAPLHVHVTLANAHAVSVHDMHVDSIHDVHVDTTHDAYATLTYDAYEGTAGGMHVALAHDAHASTADGMHAALAPDARAGTTDGMHVALAPDASAGTANGMRVVLARDALVVTPHDMHVASACDAQGEFTLSKGSPASPARGPDASPALGSVTSPALGSLAPPARGSAMHATSALNAYEVSTHDMHKTSARHAHVVPAHVVHVASPGDAVSKPGLQLSSQPRSARQSFNGRLGQSRISPQLSWHPTGSQPGLLPASLTSRGSMHVAWVLNARVAGSHDMHMTPVHDASAASPGVVHVVSPDGVHVGDMSMACSGGSAGGSVLLNACMLSSWLPPQGGRGAHIVYQSEPTVTGDPSTDWGGSHYGPHAAYAAYLSNPLASTHDAHVNSTHVMHVALAHDARTISTHAMHVASTHDAHASTADGMHVALAPDARAGTADGIHVDSACHDRPWLMMLVWTRPMPCIWPRLVMLMWTAMHVALAHSAHVDSTHAMHIASAHDAHAVSPRNTHIASTHGHSTAKHLQLSSQPLRLSSQLVL